GRGRRHRGAGNRGDPAVWSEGESMAVLSKNELHDLSRLLKGQNSGMEIAVCQLSDERVYYAAHDRNGSAPYAAGTMLLQGMLNEAKTSFSPKVLQDEKLMVATTYQPDEMFLGMLAMVTKDKGTTDVYPANREYKTNNGSEAFNKLKAKPKVATI